MEDIEGEIEKLRIGHDGKGRGAGWHLDRVEVRRLKDSGKVNSLSSAFELHRTVYMEIKQQC